MLFSITAVMNTKLIPLQNSYLLQGTCPFCHGKLIVDPTKNKFTCFNCFISGDQVDWVRLTRNVSHKTALNACQKTKANNNVFYKINEAAMDYFRNFENLSAKRYIKRRGLESADLGYAPSSGQLHHKLLKEFSVQDLLTSGLIKDAGDGRYRDFFWNRIMIPIRDENDKLVGFGGRVLDDSKPKYINTGETPIFSKRDVLFGLNKAKENDTMYIVEGYMDVLSLQQYGISNVVAALGTAIGSHHVSLMKEQGINKVILCLDSDEAGQNAAKRAIPILSKELEVSVLTIPGAKDPDEYIRAFGKEKFLNCSRETSDKFLAKSGESIVDILMRGLS